MHIELFNSKFGSLYIEKLKTIHELKLEIKICRVIKFSIQDCLLTHFFLVVARELLLKKRMEGLLSLCFCFNRWSVLV